MNFHEVENTPSLQREPLSFIRLHYVNIVTNFFTELYSNDRVFT